jgi:hypothetical protein
VIDANALGQRRRGRRPKPNKRVPLSLLVDPALRTVLADTAEENGRSITRQTEFLLEHGIKLLRLLDGKLGPPPSGIIARISERATLTVRDGKTVVLHEGLCQSDKETSDPDKKVNNRGNRTIGLASDISARAGAFLEINYPGRSKDERIARDLGISAGMAKMLRQGRAWTVARLDQAMELWPGFRGFVFPAPRSEQIANRLEQLAAGFARLADEFAELRQELRAERPRDSPCGDQAKDRPA